MTSTSGPEEERQIIPPISDIRNTEDLRVWMKTYIKRPPEGYGDMTHPGGTPLNEEEQIGVFIQQTVDVVEFMKSRGHPDEMFLPVAERLMRSAQPKGPTSEHR